MPFFKELFLEVQDFFNRIFLLEKLTWMTEQAFEKAFFCQRTCGFISKLPTISHSKVEEIAI